MTRQTTEPREGRRTCVGVLHAHQELRAVAMRHFDAGDTVLVLEGESRDRPTRDTIQIGAEEHLGPPAGIGLRARLEGHPWLFVNHACRPNTRVFGRELVALRELGPFEELTFDYETTEWEITAPFACRCGVCGGRRVRGFRFLRTIEREARVPRLAANLLARIGDAMPR